MWQFKAAVVLLERQVAARVAEGGNESCDMGGDYPKKEKNHATLVVIGE